MPKVRIAGYTPMTGFFLSHQARKEHEEYGYLRARQASMGQDGLRLTTSAATLQ
jgi:hypothetical protein